MAARRYVALLTPGQRSAALEALSAKLAGEIDTALGDNAPDSYHGAQDAISEAASGEVVLVLSMAEARELDFLAGDLLSDPEEFRNHVGGARYRVAIRAANKLGAAISKGRK